MSKKQPLISTLLFELASEIGIKLLIEPEYGYAGRVKTKKGNYFYYRSTKLDINNLGASEIAKDKAYASYFISQLGYPIPFGEAFYSDYWCSIIKSDKNASAAMKFAKKLGYPVIVKPNSESQGRGVEIVYSDEELLGAMSFIFNEIKDKVALVQKVVIGKDYRLVVLKNEVLCSYLRLPLFLVGDGNSTINNLLYKKIQQFTDRGRDVVVDKNDPRIKHSLDHLGLTFDTVLSIGKKIDLLINANLSSGGEAEDVTSRIHSDYKNMAIKLTKEMGLTFCGVDIITPSKIDEPMNDYTVIEINSAPGLDYYAESGEKQREIVKKLYKKIILSIIEDN